MAKSGNIMSISEVLLEQNKGSKGYYVHNWKELLPEGSQWFPGCPGDPACKQCGGTGYLRMSLPLGHPHFGEIFLCSCVNQQSINQSRLRTEKAVKEYGYKADD